MKQEHPKLGNRQYDCHVSLREFWDSDMSGERLLKTILAWWQSIEDDSKVISVITFDIVKNELRADVFWDILSSEEKEKVYEEVCKLRPVKELTREPEVN